jgi:hypothetical protein
MLNAHRKALTKEPDMIATITPTASVNQTANRVNLYGANLSVTVTMRRVKAGVRVRITATRINYQAGHTTQSDFLDFASVEEAAKVFEAQAIRWHNYTQAYAIKHGYTLAA